MTIQSFSAQGFRNYSDLVIEPSPTLNVFYGENAAGKTSLLEAIYYLSMGRSFRTRLLNRVTQHDCSTFTLFASVKSDDRYIPIGLERSCDGRRRLHIDSNPGSSQSEVVKHLPVLFISSNSYRYFYDGPKARRNFLDWGVFHVKHQFFSLWRQSQKLLKQRNAGLRQGLGFKQLEVWDSELVSVSEKIDLLRREYVAQLFPILQSLLEIVLPNVPLTLSYERGWSKDKPLADVFASNWQRDMQLGYTQSGPHRSDLKIYINSVPAHDVLSQGQQKQVAYSLYLAQGLLFNQVNGSSPIYLIDDLPAELDSIKRSCLANVLADLNAQVFVTGIHKDSLADMFSGQSTNMFHVKQGEIIS